jgi:hypothetical protein
MEKAEIKSIKPRDEPITGLTVDDFKFSQIFDNEGYHCDTQIDFKDCCKGYYEFTVKNLGRSDKTIK